MRQRITIIIATLLLPLAWASAAASGLAERYDKEHPVVVVCDWDKAPYEFLNDYGHPAGSNVDVLTAIMKQLGLPVSFVMKEWGQAVRTFEQGDATLIFANINRFKGSEFAATQIINYNRIKVAMTTDTTSVIRLQTLEQEGVVLKTGDYTSMYFPDGDSLHDDGRVVQLSPKVALTGLLAGDWKYFVWGEEPLKWKIKKLGLKDIHLNEVSIPVSEVHIISRDKELIDQIDDLYSRMKQSGELQEILNRWYHPDRLEQHNLPLWLLIAGAILLLAVVCFLFHRLARRNVMQAHRKHTELNEMMYKALHMGSFKVMEYDIAHDRMTNRYGDILPPGGMTLQEFTSRIHPEQQQEFRLKMQRMMEGRERHFELDKHWNAGTADDPHWLNFHGNAIVELDSGGRPAYIVNAIHDITHNEEEEKKASNLVKMYERLSDNDLVAVSFYDSNGRLADLNDTMMQLCGMKDNPDNQRFWETLSIFDVPLFRTAYSAESRNELLVCQHMLYQDMGLDKYIEFHVRPLFNEQGQLVHYFSSALNVTAQRERHHQYRQLCHEQQVTMQDTKRLQQRLAHLLQHGNRYLWRSDLKERKIYFYRVLEKPDLVLDMDTYLSSAAAEARATLEGVLYRPGETEQIHGAVFHFDHALRSDGEAWYRMCSHPLHDTEGHVLGNLGVMCNFSSVVAAQRHLEQQRSMAADGVRQKGGFMASMTHELHTPLHAIEGFSQVLQADGQSEERSEYVRIIRNSSDMLERLLNDIMEASSLADSTEYIVNKEVNFAASFEDICLTLKQRVQNPAIAFIKDNPYSTFFTSIDVGRVQQVLTNFVINALKFTTEGHIRVGYRYEDHLLYVYCEDTGIGVAEENRQVIFDRFFKLDRFTQGTGMGLAICKQIAERAGGKIGVDSMGLGKGSTFWMRIPCERHDDTKLRSSHVDLT